MSAQADIYTPASIIALGEATVSLNLAENTSINPASATNKKNAVGISFSNKYQISGLSNFSIASIIPLKAYALILNLNTFGNDIYKNSFIEIGTANSLFIQNLNFGLSIKYYRNSIVGKQNKMLGFTFGTQYHQKTYGFGLSLINPTIINIDNDSKIELPSFINFGAHRIFKEIMICGQLSLFNCSDLNLNIGIQYQPKDFLKIRFGYQSYNSSLSIGIGGQLNNFHLNLAMSFHQYLGISPALSLYYE